MNRIRHATIWRDLEDTVLSEKARHKGPQGVASLIGNVLNRRIQRQKVDS
jgi:hypothetical protein